ncbi:alpha,alpha-trehalase nth1 [Taxawa tesnikishii (nom. ined.)]|nr:alpha,alpha-trehalase nth1 [Dothideales sp. JES 119]
MRTSRNFRDTARITQALTARKPGDAPTRRSLRNFAHIPAQPADEEIDMKEDAAPDSDASSGLSSPPSSPFRPSDKAEASPDPPSHKRKRGVDALAATSENIVRRSLRQAPSQTEPCLPKKARRQPAKRIKGENGTVRIEPPPNWEEVYNTTAEMRRRVLAPVDTMGCETLAERDRPPRDQRLQTLVSLMLSSQTKDTVTAVAMKNLQENLPGGFCLDSLLKVEPALLNQLIAKVGFHNNKTKYIKATAEVLRDKWHGDIPDSIEGMMSLPGVGPKMAYLCMSAAWGRDEGIGVDVHVHRITNLWGWHKTSTPEETRASLEAWLPREKWHEINHLLVGFGQKICLPVGRKCGECELRKGLCPSAVVKGEVKKKVKKEVKVKDEDGKVGANQEVKEEREKVLVKADPDAPDLDTPLSGAGSVPDIEGTGVGAGRISRAKRGALGVGVTSLK